MNMKKSYFTHSTLTSIFLLLASAVVVKGADSDFDGLDDAVETNTGVYVSPSDTGTNPGSADSDGDGVADGLEVKEKTSPVDETRFNSFSKGLVAYWPFDGDINDQSGSSWHGSSTNLTFTNDRHGKTAKSASFDGISSYIQLPPKSNLSGDLSASGWIQLRSGKNQFERIFDFGNGYESDNIFLSPSALGNKLVTEFWNSNISGGYTYSAVEFPSGTWVHFAMTLKSNGIVELYINGKKTTSSTSNIKPREIIRNFCYIGKSNWANDAFLDGKLDDLRIYDRSLEESEIASIFSVEEAKPVVVSNVQGQQRPGTNLVDITYDVTADTPTVGVTLRISSDGGTTFSVPATTLTGAVGANVPVGTGKVITWNAGANWPGNYSTAMRFEVKVDDGVVPAPAGFAYVAAGALPSSSWAGAQAVDGFFMAKTEVTWAEFQTVRTWAAANGYDIGSAGSGTGLNHPVTHVSWYNALKWCNARSEKDGLSPVYKVGTAVYRTGNSVPTVDPAANGYRLPSEKEWEFAARGGVQTNGYEYSGSNDVNAVAWYSSNSGSFPHDVATKLANELAISDMSGNIREWCFDTFSGSDRVFRGGSWFNSAYYCSFAFRGYHPPSDSVTYNNIGFRVARSYVNLSSDAEVDTRYWSLIRSATQNGTLTGGGIFDLGATATLTATPNPGYRFTGWTSDASGTTNPLTITMDSDKTVGATFEKDLSDTDSDGLTAYDELVVYATNPAVADTDGDGLNDGYEIGIGRFSLIPGSFTWQQARTDARSKGGDLASFPTEDRWNRALQGMGTNCFEDFTGLWIGASDAALEGTWTWVNGESFSFAPWGTGRPSSTAGNTLDFAEVSGGGGSEIGKWYDRSPTTIRDGYMLEMGYATSPTVADADGDGLNDGQEQTAGTSPTNADTDGDGLSDSQEVNLTGTNPKLADTNGDGTNDAISDQDGDGLGNLAEIAQYGTDPLKADTDGDGLSDSTELNHPGRYFSLIEGSFTHAQASADAATRRGRLASFPNASDFTRVAGRARKTTQGYLWLGLSDAATEGTWLWTDGSTPTYTRWLNGQPDGGTTENHAVLMENSNQWADAQAGYVAAGYLFERVGLDPLATDTDGDGLSDGAESNTHQTNPVLDDSDSDGLTDGAEINTHSSNPKLADTDSDGLSDFAEVVTHGTNPSAKDSDADGFDDLFEINTGFNPTQNSSTPDAVSSIRTAVEFRFNAGNGLRYRIEGSTDLLNWQTVETDIIGTGGVVTRFYSIENQPKRYFRVVKIAGSSDPGGDGI
jgi:uncharacterized repeat protein (TIGR02543 family)